VIDLHSHLLPGVDDGSRSVVQSVKVMKEQVALGVTDICLTPHLRAGDLAKVPPEAHEAAYASLESAALPLPRLHRGAEVMLDRPLPPSTPHVRRFTLGGTRYLLVEFPRMVALDTVSTALHRLVEGGLLPLLAHPERYACCSPEAVAHWRGLGARMQVDATTLLSPHSRGQRARALVAAGLGDIVAADNHGDQRSIGTGRQFLESQDGAEQADLLTRVNPRAILDDAPLVAVPPLELRRSWVQKIRQLLEGGE
jgi:protein-tyrosine phosphatase